MHVYTTQTIHADREEVVAGLGEDKARGIKEPQRTGYRFDLHGFMMAGDTTMVFIWDCCPIEPPSRTASSRLPHVGP